MEASGEAKSEAAGFRHQAAGNPGSKGWIKS